MKRILAFFIALVGMAGMASAQQKAAQFPGGAKGIDEFVVKTMQYPAAAKENNVEGTVVLTFVVKADGSIGNIKVNRMVDPDLENEAIRIIKKMPKWTPATNAGKPVDSHVTQSIRFKLGE